MTKFLVYVLLLVNHKQVLGETITIDTQDDLEHREGWYVHCEHGYQKNLGDFRCSTPPTRLELSEEYLTDEVGFWTGCADVCSFNISPSLRYESMSLVAYFKDVSMSIIFDEDPSKTLNISGKNWTRVDVNITAANVSVLLTFLRA